MSTTICREDLVQSVADALQFISYYHPLDCVVHQAGPEEWQRKIMELKRTVAAA